MSSARIIRRVSRRETAAEPCCDFIYCLRVRVTGNDVYIYALATCICEFNSRWHHKFSRICTTFPYLERPSRVSNRYALKPHATSSRYRCRWISIFQLLIPNVNPATRCPITIPCKIRVRTMQFGVTAKRPPCDRYRACLLINTEQGLKPTLVPTRQFSA